MDYTIATRVAKLRRERKRLRLCRDCNAPLGCHDGLRCRSCQERETLEQRERRAARNEEKRVEAIVAVSPDIDYGMVFMLINLALVDNTNRLEAHFDGLVKDMQNLPLGRATGLPEKPRRIRYTRTWFDLFEKVSEAGGSLESSEEEGEIPEWPQSWTKSKDKDWRLPAADTYLLAKPFYTGTLPQLADKGHRGRWRRDVLPRVPELRNFMEVHNIELYDENTAMTEAVGQLDSLIAGKVPELSCRPPCPDPDRTLLGLLKVLDWLQAGKLEPLEAYSNSLKLGGPLLEAGKFESILDSFRK